MITVNFTLDEGAFEPTKAHAEDAGFDLYLPDGFKVTIPAHSTKVIDTGVHMEIPVGHVGMIRSKSGLLSKGIRADGTIDSGFSGSIGAILRNETDEPYSFYPGDKLTQIVIEKIPFVQLKQVDRLTESTRGSNGFGSTGR